MQRLVVCKSIIVDDSRFALSDVKCVGGEPVSPEISKFDKIDILIEPEVMALAFQHKKADKQQLVRLMFNI